MKRLQNVSSSSELKPWQIVTLCIVILGLLFAGFEAGRRTADNHIEDVLEMVVIDTVRYEVPMPHKSISRTVAVNVPRILFVERDSVVKESLTTESGNLSEIPTGSADSVTMLVNVETRIYEDSLYRAQVSGAAVGTIHPTLDFIEVYNRTHYVTQTVTKRNRFAVTAGIGGAYTPQGFQPTVGIQVGIILWSF